MGKKNFTEKLNLNPALSFISPSAVQSDLIEETNETKKSNEAETEVVSKKTDNNLIIKEQNDQINSPDEQITETKDEYIPEVQNETILETEKICVKVESKPKRINRLSLALPADLNSIIVKTAKENGISKNDLVIQILSQVFNLSN